MPAISYLGGGPSARVGGARLIPARRPPPWGATGVREGVSLPPARRPPCALGAARPRLSRGPGAPEAAVRPGLGRRTLLPRSKAPHGRRPLPAAARALGAAADQGGTSEEEDDEGYEGEDIDAPSDDEDASEYDEGSEEDEESRVTGGSPGEEAGSGGTAARLDETGPATLGQPEESAGMPELEPRLDELPAEPAAARGGELADVPSGVEGGAPLEEATRDSEGSSAWGSDEEASDDEGLFSYSPRREVVGPEPAALAASVSEEDVAEGGPEPDRAEGSFSGAEYEENGGGESEAGEEEGPEAGEDEISEAEEAGEGSEAEEGGEEEEEGSEAEAEGSEAEEEGSEAEEEDSEESAWEPEEDSEAEEADADAEIEIEIATPGPKGTGAGARSSALSSAATPAPSAAAAPGGLAGSSGGSSPQQPPGTPQPGSPRKATRGGEGAAAAPAPPADGEERGRAERLARAREAALSRPLAGLDGAVFGFSSDSEEEEVYDVMDDPVGLEQLLDEYRQVGATYFEKEEREEKETLEDLYRRSDERREAFKKMTPETASELAGAASRDAGSAGEGGGAEGAGDGAEGGTGEAPGAVPGATEPAAAEGTGAAGRGAAKGTAEARPGGAPAEGGLRKPGAPGSRRAEAAKRPARAGGRDQRDARAGPPSRREGGALDWGPFGWYRRQRRRLEEAVKQVTVVSAVPTVDGLRMPYSEFLEHLQLRRIKRMTLLGDGRYAAIWIPVHVTMSDTTRARSDLVHPKVRYAPEMPEEIGETEAFFVELPGDAFSSPLLLDLIKDSFEVRDRHPEWLDEIRVDPQSMLEVGEVRCELAVVDPGQVRPLGRFLMSSLGPIRWAVGVVGYVLAVQGATLAYGAVRRRALRRKRLRRERRLSDRRRKQKELEDALREEARRAEEAFLEAKAEARERRDARKKVREAQRREAARRAEQAAARADGDGAAPGEGASAAGAGAAGAASGAAAAPASHALTEEELREIEEETRRELELGEAARRARREREAAEREHRRRDEDERRAAGEEAMEQLREHTATVYNAGDGGGNLDTGVRFTDIGGVERVLEDLFDSLRALVYSSRARWVQEERRGNHGEVPKVLRTRESLEVGQNPNDVASGIVPLDFSPVTSPDGAPIDLPLDDRADAAPADLPSGGRTDAAPSTSPPGDADPGPSAAGDVADSPEGASAADAPESTGASPPRSQAEENMAKAAEAARRSAQFEAEADRAEALRLRPPRGILLEGPPGTGKTLLAKAMAGEAGLPFFAAAGSEFVEMFSGLAAARVGSLFRAARKMAPSVVFIDEIDAIARSRQGDGASVEQQRGLLALLSEMDGTTSSEGVLVIGATNRAKLLDPALRRPGRFDRIIHVAPPTVSAREEILRVHCRGRQVDERALPAVARATRGFSGADLARLVNESAIFAARERRGVITRGVFGAAMERMETGARDDPGPQTAGTRRLVRLLAARAAVAALSRALPRVSRVATAPSALSVGRVHFDTRETPREGERGWRDRLSRTAREARILAGDGLAAREAEAHMRLDGFVSDALGPAEPRGAARAGGRSDDGDVDGERSPAVGGDGGGSAGSSGGEDEARFSSSDAAYDEYLLDEAALHDGADGTLAAADDDPLATPLERILDGLVPLYAARAFEERLYGPDGVTTHTSEDLSQAGLLAQWAVRELGEHVVRKDSLLALDAQVSGGSRPEALANLHQGFADDAVVALQRAAHLRAACVVERRMDGILALADAIEATAEWPGFVTGREIVEILRDSPLRPLPPDLREREDAEVERRRQTLDRLAAALAQAEGPGAARDAASAAGGVRGPSPDPRAGPTSAASETETRALIRVFGERILGSLAAFATLPDDLAEPAAAAAERALADPRTTKRIRAGIRYATDPNPRAPLPAPPALEDVLGSLARTLQETTRVEDIDI